MFKSILTLLTIILLTGCSKVTKNTVSYKYSFYESDGDVGIINKELLKKL